jgi:ACS family glucarate transporter-like MFS transporter
MAETRMDDQANPSWLPEFKSVVLPVPSRRLVWMRWQTIAILMGFTGLNHFHRQSLPSMIDAVMRDCGFSDTDMGWVFSSFLLGYVLFMIPGGWLADWRGGKEALVLSSLGTAAMVAATGACGFIAVPALAFAAMLIVRFSMGVLTAPLFPAAGRIVHAWVPFGSRAWANGLVLGATTIGVAAAPVGFGHLSRLVSWQGACLLMGGVTALLGCIWALSGRNSPPEPVGGAAEGKPTGQAAKPASASDFVRLLRIPALLLLTATYAAVGYYEYTLFYWMKYYFSDVLLYPEDKSLYFTSIVSLSMVAAMPLGGFLSDSLVRAWGYRAGRAAVPIFGLLASAALLFAATRAQGQVLVVVLFFLAHAAIGLCEAPTWVAGLEIGGNSRGTSAAIVNTGGNLGGMLAPVVTVYVAREYGWGTGFLVASLTCLLGAVLWLGIQLKHPATSADDSGTGDGEPPGPPYRDPSKSCGANSLR